MEGLLVLFCDVDDFCKLFLPIWNRQLLANGQKQRQQARSFAISEIMTILIAFHQSHNRDFKAFYFKQVLKSWRSEFHGLVSLRQPFHISAQHCLCSYGRDFPCLTL